MKTRILMATCVVAMFLGVNAFAGDCGACDPCNPCGDTCAPRAKGCDLFKGLRRLAACNPCDAAAACDPCGDASNGCGNDDGGCDVGCGDGSRSRLGYRFQKFFSRTAACDTACDPCGDSHGDCGCNGGNVGCNGGNVGCNVGCNDGCLPRFNFRMPKLFSRTVACNPCDAAAACNDPCGDASNGCGDGGCDVGCNTSCSGRLFSLKRFSLKRFFDRGCNPCDAAGTCDPCDAACNDPCGACK